MQQTQIYEYIGVETDPIYNKIKGLKEGQAIDLGGVMLSLNHQGLYELETVFHHECFRTKKEVYDGVSKFLSLLVL